MGNKEKKQKQRRQHRRQLFNPPKRGKKEKAAQNKKKKEIILHLYRICRSVLPRPEQAGALYSAGFGHSLCIPLASRLTTLGKEKSSHY